MARGIEVDPERVAVGLAGLGLVLPSADRQHCDERERQAVDAGLAAAAVSGAPKNMTVTVYLDYTF